MSLFSEGRGEAVEGAELIAGRAIFLLLRNGGEVGDVVGRRHGDAAGPDPLEGRVTVKERSVLGIGIYEVKWPGVP